MGADENSQPVQEEQKPETQNEINQIDELKATVDAKIKEQDSKYNSIINDLKNQISERDTLIKNINEENENNKKTIREFQNSFMGNVAIPEQDSYNKVYRDAYLSISNSVLNSLKLPKDIKEKRLNLHAYYFDNNIDAGAPR